MAEKRAEATRRDERALTKREPFLNLNPVRTLERFATEMDRLFDDFGVGRRWLMPRFLGGRLGSWERDAWAPDVEVFQRNNELVVRADLPGLSKDDIKVDITQDNVTIQGERKQEHEEEREGVYRSERSYGSFYRVIPLPEGAMTDQAKAGFKDGVLEITMPAPPEEAQRGRRVPVTEGASAKT